MATSSTPRTHQTRNNTNSNAKRVSIEALTARLADGFRAEISDLNDKVAERAVQLGGTALGTAQVVAGSTKLPAYPTGIYAIADHIAALIDSYAVYANAVRENIDETDEAGDPDTADLFTEVSRAVDKQLWFLEAHVQEPTGQMRDGDARS
jgi:starvation-inducible DNA-binding protein